ALHCLWHRADRRQEILPRVWSARGAHLPRLRRHGVARLPLLPGLRARDRLRRRARRAAPGGRRPPGAALASHPGGARRQAPQRAIRAALAIVGALGSLNERLRGRGLELQARIGINTGPVVVGTVGNDLKMDYTAIGDTTNLASRLESLAAPGTILVSEATYRLVRDFFQVRPAGPLAVKGKSEPVTAYEIRGERAAGTPMPLAAEGGPAPLVGRAEEVAQLQAGVRR